jgi:pimeloyl-ACP methyl ester carboxylesterase
MRLTAICFMLFLVFIPLSFSASGQAIKTTPFIQKEFKFSAGDYHLDGRLLLPDTLGRHPVIMNIWGSGPTRMEHYIERSGILTRFTENGYAVLLYDKPGSGASGGTLSENQLLRDRSKIARAALDSLKHNRFVNPDRIGLYGSSQAAYIMALLLETSRDISFIACWSCPMENSIEQTAYQIRQYLLCAGRAPDLAERAAQHYRNALLAVEYAAYLPNAEFLNQIPEIRDELGWGEIIPATAWKPMDADSEELLDPGRMFAQVSIPVLAIYGTLDKNINPNQAVQFLNRQQNKTIQTAWIPGADHNMMVGGSGCVQQQLNGYREVDSPRRSGEFEKVLVQWLSSLAP